MKHFYAHSTNCLYFQRKGPHSSDGLNQIFNPSFTRDVSYLYLNPFWEFYEQFLRHFSHSLFFLNFPTFRWLFQTLWNNLSMPKMKRIVGGLYLMYEYEDICPDKEGVRMRTCIFVHKLNQRNVFKCFFNNVYCTIFFWECYNVITNEKRCWVDTLYLHEFSNVKYWCNENSQQL